MEIGSFPQHVRDMTTIDANEQDRGSSDGAVRQPRTKAIRLVAETDDILYRYVADSKVAQAIAHGVYRFYDLTKYMKMEDEYGRADSSECSVAFPEEEYESAFEKLPVAKIKGFEFHLISLQPDDDYISQYFALCMSTEASEAVIGDSKYRVDIRRDQFELLSDLLNPIDGSRMDSDGRKLFSHGPVEYYDVNNHPSPMYDQRWREVYLKHRRFMHQQEYRAALLIAASRFDSICEHGGVVRDTLHQKDGTHLDLEFQVRAGRDPDGWRYIEIDTSEFAESINLTPGCVVKL